MILLTLPGALVCAVLAQWMMGISVQFERRRRLCYLFRYGGCDGMVMLVYLRDAVQRAGDLQPSQLG